MPKLKYLHVLWGILLIIHLIHRQKSYAVAVGGIVLKPKHHATFLMGGVGVPSRAKGAAADKSGCFHLGRKEILARADLSGLSFFPIGNAHEGHKVV